MKPVGLIPAHAGKTVSFDFLPFPARAHPRSRGENRLDPITAATVEGSSPLTRGKHLSRGLWSYTSRLIPAHAGKTSSSRATSATYWAHPRSRGENSRLVAALLIWRGSSPLTRGKPCARIAIASMSGLIPAHAGKTNNARRMAPPLTAHPRSRGENIDHVPCIISYPGSSPLTRGKPPESAEVHTWIRLIPAHAGKTRPSRMPVMEVRAHPRSRGENPDGHITGADLAGSSPLTRGKRHARIRLGLPAGLIPAHAGKTLP